MVRSGAIVVVLGFAIFHGSAFRTKRKKSGSALDIRMLPTIEPWDEVKQGYIVRANMDLQYDAYGVPTEPEQDLEHTIEAGRVGEVFINAGQKLLIEWLGEDGVEMYGWTPRYKLSIVSRTPSEAAYGGPTDTDQTPTPEVMATPSTPAQI